MARRRTLNRKRGSRRSSIDSVDSGLLDPDTNVVDKEQTFWWNNLQENTFPRNSLIYNENETAKQLNVSSRIDSSQTSSKWWKNLEHSGSEHRASTNPKRNLSAAINKVNILQSSTTESENELEKEESLRKRKVHLKAANRKSSNNAFLNVLDNTEVSVPLKLQLKRTKYSDIYTDSDREVSQKRLQKDEEDGSNISSTGNILKSKPNIYRRRRGEDGEDQNPFQDILTEDGISNSSITRKSLEKDFSKRTMHRNIDASKDNADEQRKSTGTSQVMSLESEGEELKLSTEYSSKLTPNVENVRNANEIVQSSDESDIKNTYNKHLKLKSRFIQRARKSVGKNAFADALADDTSSTSDPNKENDIHESSLMSQSSLSPSKRSVNKSKTKIDITHESSLIRKNPRSSLNATKKQPLDVPVQTKDNEINSSDSSLDNSEPRKKTSVFLKSKSKSLLRSPAKNAKIFEKYDISAEKSNVSTKDNRVSVERGEITTRISKVHGSLTTDKSPQSKGHMSEADSSDISLTTSSNVERNISNKSNASENKDEQSENRDLMNASKSISRKSVVAKTPKKQISSSRKSTREETLKEHTPTNEILPVGRTSTNEIVTCKIISDDDLHNDIDIEQDSSISKRASKSSPGKETRLTRYSLRNRSETPNTTDIEVREVIYNLHNDANRERDSSTSKRTSKSSPDKEIRSTRNSLRNRSETPKLASKNMELSKRSINWIADIREVDNVNADSEKSISDTSNKSQVISSTRTSKVSANLGTHKSTILPTELESIDEDADSEMQVIQRNSISTKAGTSNMAVNRQSVQSSNRTSIKEDRETARKQRTLNKSRIYHSTSTKSPSKDTSFSVKLNSSKSLRKIDDFFKVKQTSTTVDKRSSDQAQNLKSQVFDAEKMEKIKTELEKIKNREMAAMKIITTDKKESALKAKSVKPIMLKQTTKKKQPIAKPMKVVDKAFLIDGKVYKAPRLPRPKYWATDRLYKFLWNRMEPRYKLATRLKSEKFVQELARIVSVIERRKNYENYKPEMDALMKEMARLKIINTRSDFYHFCQDFLPYEFRVKVVPMLLPGNKRNIPYDPEKLHIPLLD